VTFPSVIRLGGWQVKPNGPYDILWEKVGDVKERLSCGALNMRNNPDLTTGTYYRYDMDRLMVLLNYRGKDFFLSVTRQKNPSTVGRKAR